MVRAIESAGGAVEQAAVLARDIGRDVDSILITHYPDHETLDTLRPGDSDLETVTAVNRAVALELAETGVAIFVQKADRAAFRRWMQERDDTCDNRRRWVDRARLVGGAEAFRLLGLPPPPMPQPRRFGPAPGPISDELVAALDEEDEAGFEELVEELLAAGRQDVLDLAVRKAVVRSGDQAGDALHAELAAIAEGARTGPSGWAELVALPVALPAHTLPDATELASEFIGSGIPGETVELRFLPGWRSPDALASLSPTALRRVLLDLVAGREPHDLPPADSDDLATRGFGFLLGLQIDWDIPILDEILAVGLPDENADDEDTPEAAQKAALFDRWRGTVFKAQDGCVPLALVPPSDVSAEIAAFVEEAGQHTDCIDDVRECIAMARREAGDAEVVCRVEIIGDGLELSLYAVGGRYLDSMTLTAERLPVRAEEMVRVVETFVRVVKDTPGR